MQIKPMFEYFKILKIYPIVKDDSGNEIVLALCEIKRKNSDYDIINDSYTIYTVLGLNQTSYNNGSIAYYSNAFWDGDRKNKINTIINGIEISEISDGHHSILKNGGERTKFKLKKI